MVWSSAPYPSMSMIGEARLLRHVYLPGLTTSYIVWAADLTPGGSTFVISPTVADVPGGPFDDKIIAGPFQVRDFTVFETTTPNVILILYLDQEGNMWTLEYNVATRVVVTGPTKEFAGLSPGLSTDGLTVPIVSYLRSVGLRLRKTVGGIERPVVTPSDSYMIDHDVHEKESVPFVIRYVGLHGQNPDVARSFVADGDTEALYDSGESVFSGGTFKLHDGSGNDCHLELGTGSYNAQGIQFDGTFTPSTSSVPIAGTGLTIEAWFNPHMHRRENPVVDASTVKFGYLNDGTLYFQFYASGNWVIFKQSGGRRLDPMDMNYVAVSHVWGTGASAFMVINGSQVPCVWVAGTGNETPGLTTLSFSMNLGKDDVFKSMAIGSAAKSLLAILNYTKGKV